MIEISATRIPTPAIAVLYLVSWMAPLMIMPLRRSPARPISNSAKPLTNPNGIIAAATYASGRSKAPRGTPQARPTASAQQPTICRQPIRKRVELSAVTAGEKDSSGL